VYNLLGQTTTPRALGDAEDFWMTVTWVATQTPEEFPLPTKTLPPPKPTSTPGPSPTHTPITPTNTPAPTETPGPTATPEDFFHSYPFEDRIDNPEWWRLDKSIFLGSEDWKGEYYPNRTLSGSPDYEVYNGDIDDNYKFKINFDWGSDGPIADWNTDNFSVKWTRQIYLPEETTLNFKTSSDDGMRIWLLSSGQTAGDCTSTGTPSGGSPISSSTTKYGDPSTDCLLFDRWYNTGASTNTFSRTVPAGFYTLQVDYFENSGSASALVDISDANGQANVDDRSTAGGSVDCNWGQHDDYRNTNTVEYMWDEYAGGGFARNMRCDLELRGAINIPSDAVVPEFSFWDSWDFDHTDLKGWLELAIYDPVFADPARPVDYGSWTTINLHSGDTANYNMTRQVIDLRSIFGDAVLGSQLTWRFVMENGNYSSSHRRWYIDDIHVKNRDYEDFHMGMLWDLDTASQADDFITTGWWELTSTNKRGVNGMSWEDSPGGSGYPGSWSNQAYQRHYADYTSRNVRAHTVEFKGFIDVDDVTGATDLEGDSGKPLLSFWHGYDIGYRAWLEVQYTTDPYGVNANWQVVPSADPGAPYGEVLAYDESNTRTATDLSFVEVPLDQIPATRFRLRFALLVNYNASTQDGWWIDDIYLERVGYPQYTDYPFFDDAESGTDNWLMGGNWDRTTASGFYDSDHSFTDSIAGTDYNAYSNSAMTLQYPFDLNADSPTNPNSANCDPALVEACEAVAAAASHPYMSFWHWREIYYTDSLYVEWRRWDDADEPDNWHPLWAFTYRMNTLNSDNDNRMWRQHGWERVEIDLMPIVEAFEADASNLTDDDVVIRFRLYTDSGGSGDGVYLDNISIEDYTEKSHKLWDVNDDDAGFGYGDGETYTDDIDSPSDYWNYWWNGGGWEVIDWEQHGGLKAWHDSVREDGSVQDDPPPDNSPNIVQPEYTFSVLQMQNIIDLRGVDESVGPTLYFWTRFSVANHDYIKVQISVEDTSLTSPCGTSGLDQCYEHVRGWTEWETIASVTNFNNYTWTYHMFALDEYAADGSDDGKRIKIRFVSDSIYGTSQYNRDGWYLDDITIKARKPYKLISLPFSDSARNLGNWIPEGDWGLSPDLHRGSGGGPASLGGYWSGYWWDESWKSEQGWKDFFDDEVPNNELPDGTELVLDINHDPGYGSLFCYDTDPSDCPTNYAGGRWELQTGEVGTAFGPQPGEYTFITISDDGVRMRYDTVPAGGVPPTPKWNIIDDFNFHGRTVDMGTAELSSSNIYKFTVEYFESSGKGVIVVSTGSNSFSFTDTPKQGSAATFDDVPPIPYGNSSLLLDGLLDLDAGGTIVAPVMEYYTYYEMYGYGWVELSPDGGFCWGEDCGGVMSDYRNMLGHDDFDDPRYYGCEMPYADDWELRQHDLSDFAGEEVGLRFRLYNNRDNTNRCSNDFYIGWWLVDIRVLDP
jgi:hypothetical protein